jgi:hypothetical protein
MPKTPPSKLPKAAPDADTDLTHQTPPPGDSAKVPRKWNPEVARWLEFAHSHGASGVAISGEPPVADAPAQTARGRRAHRRCGRSRRRRPRHLHLRLSASGRTWSWAAPCQRTHHASRRAP